MSLLLEIREERAEDFDAIREVNKRAFSQDQESNIVDALRSNGAALLSLVATLNDRVVGHIMYSPATIGAVTGTGGGAPGTELIGAALGPMSVLPEHQRQGIGSKLIETGNQRLNDAGCPFVIVLGHANYYPRFGFLPASTFGIKCEWDVPDDVFMLVVLDEEKMRGISGLAKYRPEFSTVS